MRAVNVHISHRALLLALAVSLAVVGVLFSSSRAHAVESGQAADPAMVSYEFTQQTTGSGLGVSVSWNTPKCGEPTVFHFQGMNGSGNYQYLLNLVQLDAVGYYDANAQIVDPSRLDYQESPDMSFTFYASGKYDFWFYVMDMSTLQTRRLQIQLTVSDSRYPSLSTIVNDVVAECLAAGNKTDFEKALWLHDWVIDNCNYDNSLVYCGAEGALARGTGTCESYHRSYVMLLNRAGIETKRVEGNGHVWTGVKLDGKWYHVDATWDDGAQFNGYPDARHQYFCLNDEIIGYVHSDYQNSADKIGANSLDLNYFIKTGKIDQWVNPYLDTVSSHLKDGKTSFSFSTVHPGWPNNYKNVTERLVAYSLSHRSWDGVVAPNTLSVSYADNVFAAEIRKSNGSSGSSNGNTGNTGNTGNAGSGSSGTTKPGGSGSSGSNSGSSATTKPSSGSSASSGNAAQVVSKSKGAWKKSGGRWWYRHHDGSYTRSNWELIDGTWYLFDSAGWMRTGWAKVGGKWYYLAGSGAMKTGWIKVGGMWYYLKSSGAMATGWQKVGGSWYYLAGSGAMAANKWVGNYYLTGSGAMATNTWIGRYHVNASGYWDRTR